MASPARVHHHGKAGHTLLTKTLLLHLPDEVQQLLGAAPRRRRDDHVAPIAQGLVDDGGRIGGVVRVFVHVVEPVRGCSP